MKIMMAKSARKATNQAIKAEENRIKKIADDKFLAFIKKVDKFFKTVVPKEIRTSIKNRNKSLRLLFYIDTEIGYYEYFIEQAKNILEPLGYKNLKWEWDYFQFDWKE